MVAAQRLLTEPCVAAMFPESRPPNTPPTWELDARDNAAIDPHDMRERLVR